MYSRTASRRRDSRLWNSQPATSASTPAGTDDKRDGIALLCGEIHTLARPCCLRPNAFVLLLARLEPLLQSGAGESGPRDVILFMKLFSKLLTIVATLW